MANKEHFNRDSKKTKRDFRELEELREPIKRAENKEISVIHPVEPDQIVPRKKGVYETGDVYKV